MAAVAAADSEGLSTTQFPTATAPAMGLKKAEEVVPNNHQYRSVGFQEEVVSGRSLDSLELFGILEVFQHILISFSTKEFRC